MRSTIESFLLAFLSAATCLADTSVQGGDRHPGHRRVYPHRAFMHAGLGGNLIDVTKPPFCAKGDGVHDDTAALTEAMRWARDHTRPAQTEDGVVGGSPRNDSNWSVYLPKGVYRVTGTVSQGWPAVAMLLNYGWSNVRYVQVHSIGQQHCLRELDRKQPPGTPPSFQSEVNWRVRVIGESRDETIVRLDDNAPGFGMGERRAILSFSLLDQGSNVNYGNFLEGVTVDAGKGNPGAVGVRWACSNYGGIRDVTVKSRDGLVGVDAPYYNCCSSFNDMTIEGFHTGIRMHAGHESTLSVEHVTVKGTQIAFATEGSGLEGGKTACGADLLNLRKITLENVMTNVVTGKGGRVFVRDCAFAPDTRAALVAAEDVPRQHWFPLDDIATPEDFGAKGDGVADDTAAIQRAMDSGRSAVYFTRPAYRVDGTVRIPATVKCVDGMFAGVVRYNTSLRPGLFCVAEAAETMLEFRRFNSLGGRLIDHMEPRVLDIADIFIEFPQGRRAGTVDHSFYPGRFTRSSLHWYVYRNADPRTRKKVFAENCVGFCAYYEPGTADWLDNADLQLRSINNERGPTASYAFRNCNVWMFGAKCELSAIGIDIEASVVDIVGFNYLNWDYTSYPESPVVRSRRSRYAVDGYFWKRKSSQPIVSRDISADGRFHDRLIDDFPSLPQEDGFDVSITSLPLAEP